MIAAHEQTRSAHERRSCRTGEMKMAVRRDLQQELNMLRAENEKLKAVGEKSISFKVSPKGGMSVYGLGRFPVTLYRGQWERLLEEVENIRAFIETNSDQLKTKE
jgi:hypothetical protein